MKKLLLFIFTLSFLVFGGQNVFAYTESDVWQINDFVMTVKPVAGEEEIRFTEVISTYFDPLVIEENRLEKHGIFRYIPFYLPTESGFFAFQHFYSDWKVRDENGNNRSYEKSFRSDLNSYFLKVGEADRLIEGEQIYNISYTVANPWRYFEDHDEFYWNITGNYWLVPIENASLVFDMRDLELHGSDIDFVCFTGAFGATDENCRGVWDKTKQILTVSITEKLGVKKGLTVAISIPKDVVAQASAFTRMRRSLWANKALFLPFLLIIFFIWAWFKWGKDKNSDKPLMVEYLPADKLPPAMASYLYHLGPKKLDITAEIIWLAVHKFIKIKEVKTETLKIFKTTDYQLILLKKDYETNKKLREYQIFLLDKLFDGESEIELSSLKNKFYKHLPKIQKKIFEDLKENEYLKTKPQNRVGLFMFIAFAGMILSLIFSADLSSSYIMGTAVILSFIAGIVCILISFLMARLELEKGIDARWELKGLHHYMKIAETERFKFGEMFFWFEKLLPYAIAMGLIKKWAGIMQEIYTEPPEWFEGADPSFNAMAFAAGISGMTDVMANTVGSRPGGGSSGGSGFSGGSSGGGGGGGGGGSW